MTDEEFECGGVRFAWSDITGYAIQGNDACLLSGKYLSGGLKFKVGTCHYVGSSLLIADANSVTAPQHLSDFYAWINAPRRPLRFEREAMVVQKILPGCLLGKCPNLRGITVRMEDVVPKTGVAV